MPSWISQLGEPTISGGATLALAIVCCLQYLVHLHRQSRMRRQHDGLKSQVRGLEHEIGDIQRDRALAALENHVLREFVSQTDVSRSVELLMRRYIPNTRDDFAALLLRDGDGWQVFGARGLSHESQDRLRIEPALWDRLTAARTIELDLARSYDCELLAGLSADDRRKAKSIHLTVVADGGESLGAFVSTTLYPAGAPVEQQRELIRRLMTSLASSLKKSREIAEQQDQLRCTSEMLDLRRIADQNYETPVAMLEAFVRALAKSLESDRAALAVASEGGTQRTIVKCGVELSPPLAARWAEHEAALADQAQGRFDPFEAGRDGLASLGVDTLIGRALVVPLAGAKGHFGTLCLTRRVSEPYSPLQRQLASWAGEYLAETIVRVLAQAVVVRQARIDCLTELANRRTFDHQLEHEMSTLRRRGTECSLLLIDIDRFKSVNDRFGHLAGDEVLRQVARALRDQSLRLRSSDRAVLARYGGEEMAVILPGIGTAGALRVAEAMRAAVERLEVMVDGRLIPVTVSVGAATAPNHGTSAMELIRAADEALYRAKDEGRNQVAAAARPPAVADAAVADAASVGGTR